MPALVDRPGALMDELTELRQKRGWSGVVRQRGERSQDIVLSNGESRTDGVWIDAHPLELPEQVSEAFRL